MNGCRHEHEDRLCHHPDVVKEEGYIDWCAEGPGCPKREPEIDRIAEIKARFKTAIKLSGALYDLDDIKGERTIRSSAADIIVNCGKDVTFLLGEIDRLENAISILSDDLDETRENEIRLNDEIKRLTKERDAAIKDLCEMENCDNCKKGEDPCELPKCEYEWRGVQK